MVAMAALQVFIVKWFFTGGRKGESLAPGMSGQNIDADIAQDTCERWRVYGVLIDDLEKFTFPHLRPNHAIFPS